MDTAWRGTCYLTGFAIYAEKLCDMPVELGVWRIDEQLSAFPQSRWMWNRGPKTFLTERSRLPEHLESVEHLVGVTCNPPYSLGHR